jgi:UDP-3-O-[3-hydroxymyristoyl] glucosamine N-acyltransferase
MATLATLGDLARRFSLELAGDAAVEIRGICTLSPGEPGGLSFLANPRYRPQLAQTRAAAVVLGPADARNFRGNALIAKDPYLAYARIAALFDSSGEFTPGVHPSAVIAPGVVIPADSHVGALSVVEQGAQLGAKVFIGPGCIIGRQACIGDGGRLEARVHVGERVQIGRRVRIQPGAVIGSRGFGLARGPQGWEEVPQLGSVKLGDDVEVGANTTIDRGAIGDTVLENGVKLDNQIQIAHNVHIGAHTAIAACVGIAGSTRIGARCMIGGCTCINGHIEVADGVMILGFSMVLKTIAEPGQYGGIPARPAREWRREIARVHRLGGLEERLAAIEQKLGIKRSASGDESGDDLE